jgi:Transposase DDE domain
MVVSVAWGRRAFPLYWELLDKAGSSNLSEQQQVLTPVINLLKDYSVVVLGDREFYSVKLADWLSSQSVKFCLRLKRDEAVEISPDHWQTTLAVADRPGTSQFLFQVKVTKQKGFGCHNLVTKWPRDYAGFHSEEPWILLTNLADKKSALRAYAKRFRIEEMFRAWKRGGYCLESAKVRGQRLLNLVLLIAIAYTTSTLQGRRYTAQGIQDYVSRTDTEPGRHYLRHSYFYMGYFGATWAQVGGNVQHHLRTLLRLIPNKRRLYAKGFRAMMLAQRAF